MKRKAVIACAAAAAAIVCGILLFVGLRWYTDNKASNIVETAELYVYPEYNADSVLLHLSPFVKRQGSLRRAFACKQVAAYLKPGHYCFEPGCSSVYIARALNNGWQTPVKLTLSGGLRLKGEIARKISSQMMVDSATVASALSDKDLLSQYGFAPSTVFALFIPDTYQILWTAPVQEILSLQRRAYDNYWTDKNKARAAAVGLTPLQASILASIVKGESRVKADYARIAGVYLNRLAIGMKLQADPTVAYCYDYTLDRILLKHLKVESPYNTYKHTGLPPGPICVPDKDYLEAVLAPDYGSPDGKPGKGGNIFFCASPSFDGTHRFARTHAEHSRNAREFQRALTARRRASKN